MPKINTIINDDCIKAMKKMEANSIDTIITDPPYGLEFMGKDWDKPKAMAGQIAKGKEQRGAFAYGGSHTRGYAAVDNNLFQKWTEQWAKEALRVAKPGATLLSFGGTRTYHRMACAIEDAGWILKDCIMWLYGSGFPKATDISKQLDKVGGAKRKVIKEGFAYGMSKGQKADGYRPEDYISKQLSNEAITPQAKLWNGWKSHGLKPAYEPIIVAMKPNEGTYANNALKHGVSGLNIDGGRISCNNKTPFPEGDYGNRGMYGCGGHRTKDGQDKGRFPANLILECICDEVIEGEVKEPYSYKGKKYKVEGFIKDNSPQAPSNYNDTNGGQIHTNPECPCYMLDHQSGMKCGQLAPTTGKEPSASKKNKIYGDYSMVTGKPSQPRGLSGASRFFYTAKASKSERNAGCEGLEEKAVNKFAQDEWTKENMNFETKPAQNNHPTVKPLKLMEYLCTLTKTPTGGIVLDPFAGSGSTLIACKKTGRDFIGIEQDKSYCKIVEARLKAVQKPLL